MDIAALTLEDQFPELSAAQVRYALDEAGGDPEQAAVLCQSVLAGPASQSSFPASTGCEREASAAGCSLGSVARVAASAGAPLQPSRVHQSQQRQHRNWWPAVHISGGLPAEAQLQAVSMLQPAGATLRHLQRAGLEAKPTVLASVQRQAVQQTQAVKASVDSAQPVRVLQSHSKPQPLPAAGEAANRDGHGASVSAATGNGSSGSARSEGIHYAAVFLNEASRDRLLQHAAPLHESVSADHMTLAYRPSLDLCLELPLGREAALFVEGAVCDYRTQALAVQHPSWLPYYSEAVPHVTVSVAEGVPPREAGDLVRDAKSRGARARIMPLVGVKLLHGTVGVRLEDGSIAYSQQELAEGLRRLKAAPKLNQAAPIRILKRGEAPPPRAPSPATLPPLEVAAGAMAAPPAVHRQAQPSQPASGLAIVRTEQQERRLTVLGATSESSATMVQAELVSTKVAQLAGPSTSAQPSLDDLLDMLHLADTGPAPSAASASHPGGAQPVNASVAAAGLSTSQPRQAHTHRPRPGLLRRPASSYKTGPPSASHPELAGSSKEGLQPDLQQSCLPASLPVTSAAGAGQPLLPAARPPCRVSFAEQQAEGFLDDGGPLDLLSSLAPKSGGGRASIPPCQPHVQQDQQTVAPPADTLPSPSFGTLPSSHRQSPANTSAHRLQDPARQPPGPATLADFFPAGLSATPSPSSLQAVSALPWLLDAPPTAPAASSGGAMQPWAGYPPAGQQSSLVLERERSLAAVSGAGYESSSSSAGARSEESTHISGRGCANGINGPLILTEDSLRQAFPTIGADVLSAALEMHGGDVAEAASFLTALHMEQGGPGGLPAGTTSLPHGSAQPPFNQHTQQQQLSPQLRACSGSGSVLSRSQGAGRTGGGGRGGGRFKGPRPHTGASDPLAVAERQAMSLHLAAKTMYEKAARAAATRGEHALSKELAATSRHHADLGGAARRRANSTAYRISNAEVTNTFKVDLHGLHVEEALQILERHLTSLGSLGHPGGILLEVVTGLGRHSNTGQPRLLPAVVRYLSDAGYRFDSQEGNAGVILVHIGC